MIRRLLVLTFALSLTACGTGGDDDDDDDDVEIDAGDDDGAACTGAVYDNCTDTTDSSDCGADLQCHPFDSAGFTVCVPACDADNPCPDQDGATVPCNMMGRCRPAVANDCTI